MFTIPTRKNLSAEALDCQTVIKELFTVVALLLLLEEQHQLFCFGVFFNSRKKSNKSVLILAAADGVEPTVSAALVTSQ